MLNRRRKFRRRRYLIDVMFQGKFIILFVSATGMGLLSPLFFFFVDFESPAHVFYAALLGLVLSAAGISLAACYLLKRIASPIYKMKEGLSRLELGDLSRTDFGAGGEFESTARELEKMALSLQEKTSSMKAAWSSCEKGLDALICIGPRYITPAVLERLDMRLGAFSKSLDFFQTEDFGSRALHMEREKSLIGNLEFLVKKT
jgi:HAMP domain-containing protein